MTSLVRLELVTEAQKLESPTMLDFPAQAFSLMASSLHLYTDAFLWQLLPACRKASLNRQNVLLASTK